MKRFLSLTLAVLSMCTTACRKKPLYADYGHFTLSQSVWFEREGVNYLFFELEEDWRRFVNPGWKLSYDTESEAGGEKKGPADFIDFSQGVHEHEIVPCGMNRSCGSFSFFSDRELSDVKLQFFYDRSSPLKVETIVPHSNVSVSDLPGSYSVLAYGVFDETNEHVQVEIEPNYNVAGAHSRFGLSRRFAAYGSELNLASKQEMDELTAEQIQPFLFPATSLCSPSPRTDDRIDFDSSFSARRWLGSLHESSAAENTSCFYLSLQDKSGRDLIPAVVTLARRNPDLGLQNQTYISPLAEVTKIPIILSYCDNAAHAAEIIDEEFRNYQKYIMQLASRGTDLCYQVGLEPNFRSQLRSLLTTNLASAREAAIGSQDFIFTIVMHGSLSNEYKTFNEILADELYRIINSEKNTLTPRLVGGMVYGDSSNFQPSVTQTSKIMWCPQPSTPESKATGNFDNCTTPSFGKLDLKIINFVAPLGPFPDRKSYKDYLRQYGDKGLANDPKLQFFSPRIDANSHINSDEQVTFFNNQSISLSDGEALRLCQSPANSQQESILSNFRIRPTSFTNNSPSLRLEEAERIWTSSESAGYYEIGLAWKFPFWGGISYSATVTGKIAVVVPFDQSAKTFSQMGDPIWTTSSWSLDQMMQKCVRYCDHPYFSSDGIYQIRSQWRSMAPFSCVNPKEPLWRENDQ